MACSIYDIFLLCETNLSPEISDSELQSTKDYTIYRKDRSVLSSNKTSGGGVLVAVSNSIQSQEILHDSSLESLFISLPSHKLILNCVYIPPAQPVSTYEEYCSSVEEIASFSPSSSLILAGDFNIPSYDINISERTANDRNKRELLENLAEFYSLDQINHIRNFGRVTLDLVFSSIKFVSVYIAEEHLVQADPHHPPLAFSLPVVGRPLPARYFTCPNLRKCNLQDASDLLSTVDFSFIHDQCNIQESFRRTIALLGDICVNCSPLKRIGTSPFPKWFSRELINLVIQKKLAHKRYKQTFQPTDYAHFCQLRDACKGLSRTCYENYLNHVEGSIPHNPNSFWSFVRSSGESPSVPSIVTLNGRPSKDQQERADMFSDFFSSVFSQPVVQSPSFEFNSSSSLAMVSFSETEVLSTIRRLDIKKGAGPDNIPPSFLQYCSGMLAQPLSNLFNLSIQHGRFPEILKMGHIIPILKSGNPTQVENYRPITILSAVGKLFEMLVLSRLKPFLKPLISPSQHGFTSSKSTVTNLLVFEEYILAAMTSGRQVDVAFVDFAKAFDKVDHSILIAKLKAYGIHGTLLSWLSDYLLDRSLRVKLPGSFSREFRQISGVPQGSLLGPHLFIAFINDISSILSTESLLFADDVKIFKMISSQEDFALLQSNIYSVMDWCTTNNMKLNFSKCAVMTFGRLRDLRFFQYTLDGRPINRVFTIKDLGVTFSTDLSFNDHVQDLCKRANRMLGFINRSTRGMTRMAVFKTLYSSFVRQLLEYASPVWSPYQLGLIENLETIQRRFLRLMGIRQGLQYGDVPLAELQAELRLPNLQLRREVADVLLLFKLVNGLLDCPILLSHVDFRIPSGTRSRDLFGRRHFSRNYDLHGPLARMMRLGNQFCPIMDFFQDSAPSIRRKILNAPR